MTSVVSFLRIYVSAALSALLITLLSATGAAAQVRPSQYLTVTGTTSAANGYSVAAVAKCPTGYRVASGGAFWHAHGASPSAALRTEIGSSAPQTDATGWYASGHNLSGQALELTSTAQCLPKTALGAYVVHTREITVDPGLVGAAYMKCKTGQFALAGGGVWHKPGSSPKPLISAWLTASVTQGSNSLWLVVGMSSYGGVLDLRAVVLCVPGSVVGPGLGGFKTESAFRKIAYGDSAEIWLACPAGSLAVSGGVFWAHGDRADLGTPNDIRGTAITFDATGWYGAGFNQDYDLRGVTEWLNVWVSCLST